MISIPTACNFVYYLTGEKNFVWSYSFRETTDVCNGRLWLMQPSDFLHELCHFIEADDLQVASKNLGLVRDDDCCMLRECRTLSIELALYDLWSGFDLAFGNSSKVQRSITAQDLKSKAIKLTKHIPSRKIITQSIKAVKRKSPYRNTEWVIDKLKHNVKLAKML